MSDITALDRLVAIADAQRSALFVVQMARELEPLFAAVRKISDRHGIEQAIVMVRFEDFANLRRALDEFDDSARLLNDY